MQVRCVGRGVPAETNRSQALAAADLLPFLETLRVFIEMGVIVDGAPDEPPGLIAALVPSFFQGELTLPK